MNNEFFRDQFEAFMNNNLKLSAILRSSSHSIGVTNFQATLWMEYHSSTILLNYQEPWSNYIQFDTAPRIQQLMEIMNNEFFRDQFEAFMDNTKTIKYVENAIFLSSGHRKWWISNWCQLWSYLGGF